MRFVVTGAAGFIGSNLVDRLLADGHDVIGLDNLASGRMENLEAAMRYDGTFEFIELDVTMPEAQQAVADAQADVVCHLAAQIDVRVSVADPLLDARQNVIGTLNMLEAARKGGVRKFVFTSSGGSIYGTPENRPVVEDAPVDPHSPYAAGKAAGELYLTAFRAMYDVQTTSLALGNVYGPRQDPYGEAGVVAIFASAFLAGRQATIFGDGTSTRDYVYVGDVVEAFVRASGEGGNGVRFNIGTGIETNVRDLHALIADVVGAPDEPRFAPPRMGELQAISLDCALARAELGWKPQTDLRTGIAQTVAWIREQITG